MISEKETGPVIVKLDQLAAAVRGKMKIPGTEKTNFRTPRLRDCGRFALRCRLPRLARGNVVKDVNEAIDFPESRGRDNLMPRDDRKFSWNLRHPGGLKCSKELLCTWDLRMHRISPLAGPVRRHRDPVAQGTGSRCIPRRHRRKTFRDQEHSAAHQSATAPRGQDWR